MTRLTMCLLLLLVSVPAAAQSLKLPAIVLGAAGAADIATTAQFLSDPSYNLREINPAVNWISNPWTLGDDQGLPRRIGVFLGSIRSRTRRLGLVLQNAERSPSYQNGAERDGERSPLGNVVWPEPRQRLVIGTVLLWLGGWLAFWPGLNRRWLGVVGLSCCGVGLIYLLIGLK